MQLTMKLWDAPDPSPTAPHHPTQTSFSLSHLAESQERIAQSLAPLSLMKPGQAQGGVLGDSEWA